MSERVEKSFLQDVWVYVSRMRDFDRVDWRVYFVWIGLMLGLLFSTSYIVIGAWAAGVAFPSYVWNIPFGVTVFVLAIAVDTIGHRTVYKQALARNGEALIHHITIFCGITSVLALCLGYHWPEFWRIPAFVLVALSIIYSFFDEAMHWVRYYMTQSDRVEMWSHLFILIGHGIFIVSWLHWFSQGYPGLDDMLVALGLRAL